MIECSRFKCIFFEFNEWSDGQSVFFLFFISALVFLSLSSSFFDLALGSQRDVYVAGNTEQSAAASFLLTFPPFSFSSILLLIRSYIPKTKKSESTWLLYAAIVRTVLVFFSCKLWYVYIYLVSSFLLLSTVLNVSLYRFVVIWLYFFLLLLLLRDKRDLRIWLVTRDRRLIFNGDLKWNSIINKCN